jgi:hypothetical protein
MVDKLQKTRSETWDEYCEKEKKQTQEALADVRQYLSHDTSTNRKRLAEILRERAAVIESEISVDELAKDLANSLSLTDIPDQSLDPPLPGENTGPSSIADNVNNGPLLKFTLDG